jgi:hypothetical protein
MPLGEGIKSPLSSLPSLFLFSSWFSSRGSSIQESSSFSSPIAPGGLIGVLNCSETLGAGVEGLFFLLDMIKSKIHVWLNVTQKTSDMAHVTRVFLLAGDNMSQKMSPKISQRLIMIKKETFFGGKCHQRMSLITNKE